MNEKPKELTLKHSHNDGNDGIMMMLCHDKNEAKYAHTHNENPNEIPY